MGGWMTIRMWFCSSGLGPGPVRRHRAGTAAEGVRRAGDEEGEEDPHREHRAQRQQHVAGVLLPVVHGEGEDVDAEDRAPEEDRALERAPQRDDGEDERRRAAAHLRHVLDAEVVRHQRVDHRQVRAEHADQEARSPRRRTISARPARWRRPPSMPTTAPKAAASRPSEDEDRSEPWTSSGLRRGWPRRWSSTGPAPSPASAARYSLEWFTISRSEREGLRLVEGAFDHHADALAEHLGRRLPRDHQ